LPGHDIIVIRASAGGVEAVSTVVRGLPRDLPAAVFVVVHFPAYARSVLPQILRRAGPLPAAHPEDGETIQMGRIYVAPPGRHLLIEDSRVRLVRGPRENGAIPAVDPLFRSAARWHRARVVGVVLSGNLDDGTAGLVAIKHRQGVAVVQDPAQALCDGMPRSAVENAPVDHVVPLDRIGALLGELARTPAPDGDDPTPEDPMDDRIEVESGITAMRPGVMEGDDNPHPGHVSGFTCPECHGALWEVQEDRGDALSLPRGARVHHGVHAQRERARRGGGAVDRVPRPARAGRALPAHRRAHGRPGAARHGRAPARRGRRGRAPRRPAAPGAAGRAGG
jgi:two-component system chemotaxis response regulator CheB